MKIQVFDIPEEGLDLEVEETPQLDGIKVIRPFKAIFRVEKKGSEVLVRGILSGEIELQCSRCLKEYPMPIKTTVEVNYHPLEEISKEELVELKKDEMDVDFYREGEIDTENIVRDQIFLSIPMKPLCSEDCKGLCPTCGVNLNEENCTCCSTEIDPRMAVLQSLLRRMRANG